MQEISYQSVSNAARPTPGPPPAKAKHTRRHRKHKQGRRKNRKSHAIHTPESTVLRPWDGKSMLTCSREISHQIRAARGVSGPSRPRASMQARPALATCPNASWPFQQGKNSLMNQRLAVIGNTGVGNIVANKPRIAAFLQALYSEYVDLEGGGLRQAGSGVGKQQC